MTRTRPIAYVRLDARRRFYLAVGAVGALGTAFAVGLVVGQQFPSPIPEHFEVGYTNGPETSADIDAPGQGDLFTFYASLEGEVAAPVVPDVRPALVEPDPALEPPIEPADDGVGETVAAADDHEADGEAVRAVPRIVEPEPAPVGEDARIDDPVLARAPVAAAPNEEPGAAEAAAIGEPVAVADSARPLERRVVREPAVDERSAAPAQANPANSDAVENGADSRRYEVVVHEAGSWDDADRARQHLREAGLRATVVTRGTDASDRSWAVVLRGEADEAEVRRQERLASRVLRAELPRR